MSIWRMSNRLILKRKCFFLKKCFCGPTKERKNDVTYTALNPAPSCTSTVRRHEAWGQIDIKAVNTSVMLCSYIHGVAILVYFLFEMISYVLIVWLNIGWIDSSSIASVWFCHLYLIILTSPSRCWFLFPAHFWDKYVFQVVCKCYVS